jgi:hypothetical protein
MDSNLRDLRELAIHLARYNPVGPAPDDIYLKLARKVSRNITLATELSTLLPHLATSLEFPAA